VIVVDPPGQPELRLFGVVRGLVPEVAPLRDAVAAFAPEAVGLGISPDELEALAAHFLDDAAEPVVPLGGTEVAETTALARYGEVGVPHPAFVDLLAWGRRTGLPVVGMDPGEDEQAEMFVAHIGYFELVRRTVRERRAGRKPPPAVTADEFALAWDREIHPGRGSERYALAREHGLVASLLGLRTEHRRVAVVVDRDRVPRLAPLLAPERSA